MTANIPSMRNPFKVQDVLDRAYVENATLNPGAPREAVPTLLPKARPIHEFVKWMSTCRAARPPPTRSIWC